jgi:hypothetical protein
MENYYRINYLDLINFNIFIFRINNYKGGIYKCRLIHYKYNQSIYWESEQILN